MMDAALPPIPTSPVARYWTATRPYSFTAAVVPVLLGSLVAVYALRPLRFDFLAFLITIVGAIAIQAVANVVNDFYDSEVGLDRHDNYGALNAIVRGVISDQEAKRLIAGTGVVAFAVGIWFMARVGWQSWWLILGGGLLAFFYTAPPVQLKHHALGDLAVALGFGLGIAYGSFLVQAHNKTEAFEFPGGQLLLYILPSLFLVVAILHANNHRDREADRAADAATIANTLTQPASRWLLRGLLIAPYVVVLLSVVLRIAALAWALTLVTLPLAIMLERRAAADDVEGMYVPDVAKLHGLFGIVGTIALIFANLFAK